MFEVEDVLRVKQPCFPLFAGGELLQVDTDDHDIELRILASISQRIGQVHNLPRHHVENYIHTGVFEIEES
ncbi:MAG TPA: hypothetical protein EYN91_13600 [Candidatus Melainabacteria bacterium]|nr:hypothetical protein [Candidatus Melainabacteria bacterium]HIN65114.1 hypothetical protein [Candidatus Obscuribacterales bacterium]